MGCKCKGDCNHKPYDNYDDLLSCCEDKNQPIFYVDVEQYKAIKNHEGYGNIKGKKHIPESDKTKCCNIQGGCKKKDCKKCTRKFKGKCCC